MRNIITANQFVAGIFSVLALQKRRCLTLPGTELDRCFEQAFEALVVQESSMNVSADFSFFVDALHGDSAALREALLTAQERDLIELQNPAFQQIHVTLDDLRAERYLTAIPLNRGFLFSLVAKCFAKVPSVDVAGSGRSLLKIQHARP